MRSSILIFEQRRFPIVQLLKVKEETKGINVPVATTIAASKETHRIAKQLLACTATKADRPAKITSCFLDLWRMEEL